MRREKLKIESGKAAGAACSSSPQRIADGAMVKHRSESRDPGVAGQTGLRVLEVRRENLLIAICVAAAIVLLIGCVNAYLNLDIGRVQTIVYLTSLAVFSLTPFIIRRTRSIELGAGLLVLASIGPTFMQAYYQGGLQSPYLVWFVVLPVMAPLFLGLRLAVFSGLVAVTCYTAFYALELTGNLPAAPLEGADFSSFINLVLAASFGTFVGVVTVRSARRATLDLEVLRTDLMRKAVDLEDSETRKSAILDASLSGIVSCDSQGCVTEFNPAAERMFGFTRSEALGCNIAELFIPKGMVATHKQGFARYLRTGDSRILDTVVEVVGKCADGREIPVELLVQRIGLQGPPQFTAYLRDLRQQRLAEATLRRREEELQRSQRLEGVGRLAGGIAHDFNNLLTIVGGYGESIASETDSGSSTHEEATEIVKAVDRAAMIIQQLLAFSRRQDLKLEDVGLSQLLRDFETTLSTIVPPHVELVMDLEEATWLVTADTIQIERIVMNLALNACDAMEQPGTLSVSLHHVEIKADDAWRPDHLEPGLYAKLDVIDTGEGMSADVLGRVFEPFFTTKPTGKGTGLGLATAYGIARQCGGHIEIQSSVGNGSTVSVYFPKAVGGETRSSLAVLGATGGERATILLVDDESSIRKTMSMQLQKQGYEVIEAADGEEAVNVAMAPGVRVDLLVSDVVMPRKDGPAVAAELIKVFPQMKTILMSGYSERLSSEFDQLLPDVEFLVKPLRMKDLTETVARLLATRSEYR